MVIKFQELSRGHSIILSFDFDRYKLNLKLRQHIASY